MDDNKWLGNIFRDTNVPMCFDNFWNQITPENYGKWGIIERFRNTSRWELLDSAYNYAQSKGYPFKQHTFVWNNQQPEWINELSESQQFQAIKNWIQEYGKRYPNTDYIDVVNEPINQPASYKNALGGDNSLYGTGWDWVIRAFELARKYNPNARLLINEHNIISSEIYLNTYVKIIELLQKWNLIDGIGIQCHSFNICDMTENQIENSLNSLAETGLPIYVSELDINGDDNLQLKRYESIFPILWKHTAVKGITLWGYLQDSIWVPDAYLLTREGKERPALTWLKKYLKKSQLYQKEI